MKRNYYLYGILVLLLAFIAYNYYSASQAETNISEFIQAQADSSKGAVSIKYSSINVSPFLGDITFKDVNIIQPRAIRRAEKIKVDLSYFDFLKFSIGGTEYGLKHLSNAFLLLNEVSHINRNTRAELTFEKLTVDYSGDLWNAVLAYLTQRPIGGRQKVVIRGNKSSYHKPQSSFGAFKADSLFIYHDFGDSRKETNKFQLTDIIWNPPQQFRQKYAFIIEGFGLHADSIFVDRAGFSYSMDKRKVQISEGIFKTELLSANFYGTVVKKPVAVFKPLHFTITEMSPKLENALQNLKQLFNLAIPVNRGAIQFELIGPVTHPKIASDKK
ncbi:MAG TPA: hypothetical protein VK106_03680 [Balneolaceae bacterium]|nr:hypothetical protein [Balneolaceae bacterium]